jgi:hypothetical protein
MGIPERFYRIAKTKLGEIRDRIETLDEEMKSRAEEKERQRVERGTSRDQAAQELNDALSPGAGVQVSPRPANPPDLGGLRPRTPDQIARGVMPSQGAGATASPDPLLPHYRLLGVEPGSDFTTVQAAHSRLAARCDPSRFPEGSADAKEAEHIRKRLEETYNALRDALDATARRFDLLEIDAKEIDEKS